MGEKFPHGDTAEHMIMRPGICGIISLDGSAIDTGSFYRMQEKLAGNSPNRTTIGEWYALAQAGYESSGYEDNCLVHIGESTVCFEGRIDNRLALAKELGINANSATYSGIINAAFNTWGPHFYKRILGAFTACIVLAGENRALLVNDHMGLRPVYLSEVGKNQLAFGSDICQLLAQNNALPQLNRAKVLEMFSPLYVDDEGWSDPGSTLLERYATLPHGTSVEINRDGRRISTQYWRPPDQLQRSRKDIRAYAEDCWNWPTTSITEYSAVNDEVVRVARVGPRHRAAVHGNHRVIARAVPGLLVLDMAGALAAEILGAGCIRPHDRDHGTWEALLAAEN